MNIRSMDRAHLHHENGVETERLCPWPVLNAPFEGSWVVVRPGTASVRDSHPDYEMWIGVRGEATIEAGGERRRFGSGDILYLPPQTDHTVINEGDQDFEMYDVWWDPHLAEQFADRHERAVARAAALDQSSARSILD